MDVLRHYGEGTLSNFLGSSCADEHMDHNQLLLAPYTPGQAAAQVANLPVEYGAQGQLAKAMIDNYVKGINAYIQQALTTHPELLPADYAAAVAPPQPWNPGDVVAIAGLIGGIFGGGGGGEVANAALLQYLDQQLGTAAGATAFTQFKAQNDPDAPTTIVDRSFPYEIPGTVDPATVAIPDNAAAPLGGGPTDTAPDCSLIPPSTAALGDIAALLRMPAAMSNALVVDAAHSADGNPIAVFGPQVSYFAPEILMQEDLHSPDYAAEGASFPGTGLVELGRGQDYAWSATSAGTDLTDQRLELICNPNGGAPDPQGLWYEYNGACIQMTTEHFKEVAFPKPGGQGQPTYIDHVIHLTVHGVVQGWTTAQGGKPVAVADQRSTFGHDVDSVIGFLHFGEPALTHSAQTWTQGAAQIGYTFNWFYVDNRDIAYFVSGLDPVRPPSVDPTLPTWGTGIAEWQGFLPAAAHPQEINPPQGFFDSWNNKPAPQFSASDDQYGYGPVYRVQMLTQQINSQLSQHGGKLTRANLVQAMATAATQDLDGLTVLSELLSEVADRSEPSGVAQMLQQLTTWYGTGSHRIGASSSATEYLQSAAVAIMDQLNVAVIRQIFDRLFQAGGVIPSPGSTAGYTVLPMGFVNEPNSGGAHLGSAYDGGWEGYVVKVLEQMQGQPVAQPFTTEVTSNLCGGGLATCPASIDAALAQAYQALVAANGGSTDVASWTQDSETAATGTALPAYDAIAFRSIGIVGQPDIPWQNRPTFQQVVSFPAHRPR
jgi:acyl-homoserine lactone acylase PvdQ